MKFEIKAPSVGESITEVVIARWIKNEGEAVAAGEAVVEVESEKASLEIVAEQAGVLSILRAVGDTVKIGEVLGYVDDAGAPRAAAAATKPVSQPEPAVAPSAGGVLPGPAARKLATEMKVDPQTLAGSGRGGRVTKGDLLAPAPVSPPQAPRAPAPPVSETPVPATAAVTDDPRVRRVPMTPIRRKIAERLVAAQHTAAILTTFNEVDMSALIDLRKQLKESFKAKHGVGLGFMSLFAKAAAEALKVHPVANGFIEGNEIVYHDFQDIGIAVGSERGLVVPVVRDAGSLSIPGLEKEIARLAGKARDGKLSIADMSGGTFTISNGGVYGSLLSTPILTPPQSAILGMHKIQDRPIALAGQVVIRPMMYLAVSYDHRLLDGKNAVEFLVSIKGFLEKPETMGAAPGNLLQ